MTITIGDGGSPEIPVIVRQAYTSMNALIAGDATVATRSEPTFLRTQRNAAHEYARSRPQPLALELDVDVASGGAVTLWEGVVHLPSGVTKIYMSAVIEGDGTNAMNVDVSDGTGSVGVLRSAATPNDVDSGSLTVTVDGNNDAVLEVTATQDGSSTVGHVYQVLIWFGDPASIPT